MGDLDEWVVLILPYLRPPCPTSWLLTTTWSFSQYPPFPTTGSAWCDPPPWRTNIANAGFHYYSPAICPRGFVVGPSCGIITKERTDEGFPAIATGETAVYCVPSGLTCTTELTDYRGGVRGFARDATALGALFTFGAAIQIRWVAADLTKLETHPLTPGLRLATTGSQETTRGPVMGPTITIDPATLTTGEPGRQPAPDQGDTDTVLYTDANPSSPVSLTLIYDDPEPTSSLGPASSAASGSGGGGLGSLDRPTSIVVIVLVTVIAGIALWIGAFLLVRQQRKKAARRKGSRSTREGGDDETCLENGRRQRGPARPAGPAGSAKHARKPSGATKSIGSPVSELDATGTPAIGSTPNPAELEGDLLIQPPERTTWVHQRLWLKSPALLQPPQSSPRSLLSTRSTRRTIRESFGEKVNDPAAALGRLKIPNPLAIGRSSPTSASPSTRSFWRMPRSLKTTTTTTTTTPPAGTTAAARRSAQLPKPSPRSAHSVSVRASRASTPGRGKPGWREDGPSSTQSDATL
ncbi:hypothetical protein MYCTH_2120773 [Thermothelomyces thermophilus ATCC 42464]|uniref:Uncharacterized protein n=1 Tax=Thermothelomyces thermophilus (strain ATCC 42464 / BCRC 31852 / DSM 1799) TaxID=573729 RepID=G2QLG9_THET4|nr:uncharacterized protein MYCTH_2120773 [Thermothelomyces thermophilus ATCC 42464]AEO60800.1 hypothetical protein MYCTH_2120773 [Thermothelomyces thermophilus ATCC 42464]